MDLKSAIFFIGIPYFSIMAALLWVWFLNLYHLTPLEQALFLVAAIAWPIPVALLLIDWTWNQLGAAPK